MPGVEASGHVDHVAVAGSFEQAAGDHAAVSALAVDGYLTIAADGRQSLRKRIQRVPLLLGDVSGLPFAFAADV